MTHEQHFLYTLHSLAPVYAKDVLILDPGPAYEAIEKGWATRVERHYRLGVKVRITELAVEALGEYLSGVTSTPLRKASNG